MVVENHLIIPMIRFGPNLLLIAFHHNFICILIILFNLQINLNTIFFVFIFLPFVYFFFFFKPYYRNFEEGYMYLFFLVLCLVNLLFHIRILIIF